MTQRVEESPLESAFEFNEEALSLQSTCSGATELERCKVEIAQLKRELRDNSTSRSVSAELDLLQSCFAEMRSQLLARDDTAKSMMQLEDTASSTPLSSALLLLRGELDDGNRQLSEMAAQLEQERFKSTRLQSVEKDLHFYRSAAQQASLEAQEAVKMASQAVEQHSHNAEELHNLTRELGRKCAELRDRDAELSKCKEELVAELSAHRMVELRCLDAERRVAEMAYLKVQKEQALDEMQRNVSKREFELETLERSHHSQSLKVSALETQVAEAASALDSLQREKSELQLQVGTLQVTFSSSQQRANSSSLEVVALKNSLATQQEKVQRLNSSFEALKLERDAALRGAASHASRETILQIEALQTDLGTTTAQLKSTDLLREAQEAKISSLTAALAKERELTTSLRGELRAAGDRLDNAEAEQGVLRSLDATYARSLALASASASHSAYRKSFRATPTASDDKLLLSDFSDSRPPQIDHDALLARARRKLGL